MESKQYPKYFMYSLNSVGKTALCFSEILVNRKGNLLICFSGKAKQLEDKMVQKLQEAVEMEDSS